MVTQTRQTFPDRRHGRSVSISGNSLDKSGFSNDSDRSNADHEDSSNEVNSNDDVNEIETILLTIVITPARLANCC